MEKPHSRQRSNLPAQADNSSTRNDPGAAAPGKISAIKLVTWSGLLLNVTLSAIKVTTGLLGHSRAVVADGIHSFSDLSTDLAILVGVRYWTKPADESHPHGHEKIESLITAAIAIMLAGAGVTIGYDALSSLENIQGAAPTWPALAAAGLSIVTKEALFRWTRKVARKTGSSAVAANAWHHRSDALSSIPVFATVGAAMIDPSLAFLDRVGAVVVSVFILRTAWQLLAPELRSLADSSAPESVVQTIRRVAEAVPKVHGVHSIRTRQVGGKVSVDLHVTVDPEMSVRLGHAVSEQVRTVLLAEESLAVLDVVVHLEPDEPHED